MGQVLEIRGYELKPGVAERFHRLVQDESLPLMLAAGIDVVAVRPSLHAPDSYLLIRAYDSLEHRSRSQAAFYGGKAWLEGPADAVMASIKHYTTAVIEADDAMVAGLRQAAIHIPA